MLHRVRSLVTVLALGVPVLAAADRIAPQRKPTPISAFLTQDKYTYCDAKTLSGLWKQSVGDAKARVGMKIQAGGSSVTYLDQQLALARKGALKDKSQPRCTFVELGLTYPDAERLGKLWKTTPDKAKAMAEDKVLYGNEKLLMQLVAQPAQPGGPGQPVKKQAIDYFFDSQTYTYCDAKQLAKLWKISVSEGKTTIGAKIEGNATDLLDDELARARKQKDVARCDYMEAGLSFDDVTRLAKLWKLPLDKAKAQIEVKATMGLGKALHKQVAPPTMTPPKLPPPPPAPAKKK